QLVPQTEVKGEPGRDLPLILYISKDRCLADRRQQTRQVANERRRLVEEERCKRVCEARPRISVAGGRAGREAPRAARIEDACLQVVAQAADVGAPFERVIACDSRPVVYQVEVR